MQTGLPIDILIFAAIAAYLVFRLRNVLGRRDGHQGGYHDPFDRKETSDRGREDARMDSQDPDGKDTVATPFLDGSDQRDEKEEGPVLAGLRDIRARDPGFDPDQFLEGACQAFELILRAYAGGDTATLKPLLSTEVCGNFIRAIRDREQAGEVLEDTLIGIDNASLQEAYVDGHTAFVIVRFVSQQINATRGENGDIVDGDPDQPLSVSDCWTFSRDTRSGDPNWVLVATQSID